MALPVSPDPISLGDLQTNFGGTDPASFNEYYRRGTFVSDVPGNNRVPTTGAISLEDFYGAVTKITVVNNGTLTNVSMQNAFTISGINYWTRNIEKEYINNGTIGSNDAGTASLTVSGGKSGIFTLTNNGNIYGARGQSNGGAGGTAIRNNTSGYSITNSSTGRIWGGGGAGGRGGDGGAGGRGGTGTYVVTRARTDNIRGSDERCGNCATRTDSTPNNAIVRVSQFDRIFFTSSERWGGPTPGNQINGLRRGNNICEINIFGTVRGQRVVIATVQTFCAIREYRETITIPAVFGTAPGCPGGSGGNGGNGGDGQGYQGNAQNGVNGQNGSNGSNCADSSFRNAGRGGNGGAGGRGGNGGSWGQSGNTGSTGSTGSTGNTGFNEQTGGSSAGSAGFVGNSGSSGGRGGYYLEGSAGASVTLSNFGSVLGGAT